MADSHNNLPNEAYGSSSEGLKLDLYNFESTYAEDSPYILTSPRSLEACAQLDIKPVELLVKPLIDFEEDCLLTQHLIGYARHMYEAYESNRLEKLKFCRQIRERIILEDDESDSEEESVEDFKPSHVLSGKSSSLRSSMKYSQRQAKDLPVVELGRGDQSDDMKVSCQNLQPKPSPSEPRRRDRLADTGITKKKKKKQPCTSTSLGSVPNNSTVSSKRSSRSFRNSNVSKTSSRGSNISRATSMELLSDKDKRILDILETKHLVNQAEDQIKHWARLAWEDERNDEEETKMETRRRIQQNMIENNSRRQKKQELKHRRRLNEEINRLEINRQQMLYNEEKHKRLIKTQNELQALEIHQKQLKEIDKKKRQERSRQEREHDEEEFRQMVNQDLALSFQKAANIRNSKEQLDIMEHQRRNAVERAKHEALRELVSQQAEEDSDLLRTSINLKQDRAERNLQNQIYHRQQQIQHQRK